MGLCWTCKYLSNRRRRRKSRFIASHRHGSLENPSTLHNILQNINSLHLNPLFNFLPSLNLSSFKTLINNLKNHCALNQSLIIPIWHSRKAMYTTYIFHSFSNVIYSIDLWEEC